MSTTIYEKNGLTITRYWGGNEQGLCYQVNMDGIYRKMTASEFGEMLVTVLKDHIEFTHKCEAKILVEVTRRTENIDAMALAKTEEAGV